MHDTLINPFVKIIPVKFKILDQRKRYEEQPLNSLITKHNVFISLLPPQGFGPEAKT